MHRVVITGLGCLTPIGNSPDALWRSLELGLTGITPLPTPRDPTLKFSNAGQIPHVDTSSLSPAQLQTTERSSQLALLAARQAIQQSALTSHHPSEKIAILLGCSTNGRQAEEPETARLYTQNARIHPLTVPRSMASNGASQVAIDHHITGPALTISTACASGAHALGLAFHMVRSGLVSAALAGAHEAPLTQGFLRAWDSMRVVSPTACRPFSQDRDGMSLAEGAAVLALETLESARARQAPIFAEMLGFGMSTDAHHITQPKPEGPAQAMHAALADAAQTLDRSGHSAGAESLTPESIATQIAYINAHGTGTQANDATETRALELAFGSRLAHIPISGTKGFHGHSLGASSAVEALITVLALHHHRAPFTLGTVTPDPTLPLDLILATSRMLPPNAVALTNSLAFGGLNAMLCLRSYLE